MPALRFCALALISAAWGLAGAADDPIAFIEKELAAGQKTVTVAPGVYRLTPRDNVYLKLKNLSGVTIDFTNVEFIGLVNTRMFEIENCADLTLKGLTVDYDPLPFTQARIVEIDREKNWTVKIIEGYPTEGIGNGKSCWPIQVYGRESLELVNPMRYREGIDVARLGPDTYRISGGLDRTGEVGDIAVFTCCNFEKNRRGLFSSQNCRNLRVEGFTFYSSTGLGFVESGNTRAVYLNCRLDRRPPETDLAPRGLKRLRSTNHDAFHCKDDPVGPQIIGCTARYHCDDCVNIAGMYSLVVKTEGNLVRILSSWSKEVIKAEDSVQIMTFDGQCLPEAKALSVEPDVAATDEERAFLKTLGLNEAFYQQWAFRKAFKIQLDRPVELPRGSVIISSNRCGNGFLIKDCTFGHSRARGLLIKASNGVIENNTIDRCWSLGIQISPEYEWMEGGCSSDLKILGNRLNGNRDAGIGIFGNSGAKVPLPANSHRNFKINGNVITDSSQGIVVAGCTGLELIGNSLEIRANAPEAGLVLKNVADITQKDNQVKTIPPLTATK